MKPVVLIVVLFAAAVQGKCNESCTTQTTHYDEIGCKPVFSQSNDCCATYYDCSAFNAQEPNKCYFHGQVYNVGDPIDSNFTGQYCAAACVCERRPWEDISCANIECPESWHNIPPPEGCFYAYHVYGCCSHETVCPPFDKLASCEVNGTTYYEGQKIDVPGRERDLSCVCGKNFQGRLEAPFCRVQKCGTDLRDTAYIRKNCAPVYYGQLLNCPIQWECLQDGDHVIPNKGSKPSDKKCRYENLELNIGDKLSLNRTLELNCECRIPPLVTCIQKPHEEPKLVTPLSNK